MAADLEARIWGVMAASGTGKGLWVKRQLKALNPTRLVIWDFKREYGVPIASSLAKVHAAMVKAGPDGPLRIGYCPVGTGDKSMRKEFETLCELVYAWEHCVFIAEELSMVTMPSWAPPAWRKMTTSGRHQGVHIIGIAQMPALIDKAFLGNCTLIHVGPLHEEAHRGACERSLDIQRGSLADLVKFQFIEKNRDTGELTSGVIVPKGVKAPPVPCIPSRRGRPAPAATGSGSRPTARGVA